MMSGDKKIFNPQQKLKIRSQYIGLLAGLFISLFILKQEIYRLNILNDQKTKYEVVDNEQKEHIRTSTHSTENKSIDKFPEISGLAKILILTIHAPWIFNGQDSEENYEGETGFGYSLNTFFSRFSLPVLKERSDLENCEDIPLS